MGRKRKQEGFCSVCGDMTTSSENPLLTCNSCGTIVHGGCYGDIQLLGTGWKCQVCEYTGEANTTSCQLCCGLGGAMKTTDLEGWSHIVCALFIPEGRFGDVNKMEPILISVIPAERFGKICYICAGSKGKLGNARRGACIKCAAPKCSRYFHVTCGQKQGLLCEDSLLQESLPYVGYCRWHMMKLPADSSRKRLPAYSPNLVPQDKRDVDVKIAVRCDEKFVRQKMKEPKGIIVVPGKETCDGRGHDKNVAVQVGPRRSKRLKTAIENDVEMVAMVTESPESPVIVKTLRPRKSVRKVDRADDQMHRSSSGVKRRLFTGPDLVHEYQMQALIDNNNEVATNTDSMSVESLYENGGVGYLIADIKAKSPRSETLGSSSFPVIEDEFSSQDLLNSAHGLLDSALLLEASAMTLVESSPQQLKSDSCESCEGSESFTSENIASARYHRSTRVRRFIEATGQRSPFQVPTDRERMEILEFLFKIQNGRPIIYIERQEGNKAVTVESHANLFADGELNEM